MKIKVILLTIALILSGCSGANTAPDTADISAIWQNALDSITSEEISQEIEYLASEELEGRRSQTPGSILAGDFIANFLSNLKLKKIDEDYFQDFKYEDLSNYPVVKNRLQRARNAGYFVPNGGRNVVGILEGSEKKDEYIVLTAHYDHMGLNPGRVSGKVEMNPGADDNASGTAALMEIAEAMSILAENGHRPKRSIIFLFADSEEWGLLGSRYFAENSPVPLESIVSVINMDMLGRNEGVNVNIFATPLVDDAPERNPDLYRYSKEASELMEIKIHLLGEEGRERNIFYRSDHYSFFEISRPDNKIPVIFFTAGLHEDYHTGTDTADKIDNEKVAHIAKFILTVTLKVSEAENPPDYKEQIPG